MYCSSCGVAVAQGLSYCNYCGAKLNGAKGDNVIKSSEVKPESLINAARVLLEPIPSVTEHTTREFEPLYSERTSR